MDEQERQIQYYQFPKFLLELMLSQNARIIYMLLYDRARISRKNNWADEDGRIYAVFPIEELSQKTGKCKSSVKKALKELDDAGLLIREFGGFSKLLEPRGIDHSESGRNNQSELIRNSQCTCLANRLPIVIQRDRRSLSNKFLSFVLDSSHPS